jgi:hypothetical protein
VKNIGIMYSQSLVFSFFIILVSFGLCFGSYSEETNDERYNERMMEIKFQQFHVMKKAHHRSIAPSQSHHNMVNVDNYGAIANDGRVDNKVT